MSKHPPASLGRRLLPALAVTTAASGMVALLDRPSSGAAGGVGGIAGIGVAVPGQSTAGAEGQVPEVSSTLPAATQQPTAAPVVPAQEPQQQPQQQPQQPVATPAPTKAAPTSGACQGKTLDGPSIDTRWGPVQVEAVISSSGQICDVGAIKYPNSHRRSQQINNYALPILHKEVMAAQSLNINGVSGATITSIGYARSLQAILDKTG
jgi:uncharacterized protein with FMN-binding domain